MPPKLQDAVRLHQEGRLGEAEPLYREALGREPGNYDALHMLGILKLQQGRPDEAAPLIAAALKADAKSHAAHANYGLALSALQRHEEALASYERSLKLDPRNAATLASRGDTLCDLGRQTEALASFDAALAIDRRHVSALVNRGIVLRELGRQAEALASYDAALAVEGQDAEAWNNRGVVLHELGRDAEALSSYERAISLRPDYPDALINRGNVLLVLKRPAEALTSIGRALALKPGFAEGHVSHGHAFYDMGHRAEALKSYDQALSLAPDQCDAHLGRARVLRDLDRDEEALAVYRKVHALNPTFKSILNDLVDCSSAICEWSTVGHLNNELIAHAVKGDAVVDPFVLLRFDSDPQQQLACARNWLTHKKVTGVSRTWNRADFHADRIRVAYLSADFHRHATAHLVSELFELHDRRRFEIIGVSFGPDDRSSERARLIKSFDRFFDVRLQPTVEAATLIRNLKPQIAVDLKGHTIEARIELFAERLAPIQVAYLGYPGTTGADFIDYVIADDVTLPFDQQRFFSEQIVRLPDSYQVNDSQRPISTTIPTRNEVGLPDEAFVFCCFNNSYKISASVFESWMRILIAVPGGVLWLYQSSSLAMRNLRREAEARGVNPDRLIFAPHRDLADHLARLTLAELFLDTLPYNAHTTASDALWAGVPVLTCKSGTFAGRVAASLLRAVGLHELIVATLDDYEALAIKLAQDRDLLNSIRARLVGNRARAPLFDTDRFRRHLEMAYTAMWEQWLEGRVASPFRVIPSE